MARGSVSTPADLHSSVEESPLVLNDVVVDFGATRALDHVSLQLKAGEIVGLIGHNGAGKSTLFNVVSGAVAATHGTVQVAGTETGAKPTPREMARLGITVIHQEPALAHNLRIEDNLFLGQEDLIGEGRRRDQARDALREVGLGIDPSIEVGRLGLGERQLVDLARGIVRGQMSVLMLDEPTAALGRAETETLHRLIRRLADNGVAIIYVSHRLPDILEVCDRIVILRAGRVESDGPSAKYNGRTLAKALAPDLEDEVRDDRKFGQEHYFETAGELEGIHAAQGEIIGLFGMAAGAQFRFLEDLFGQNGKYEYRLGGVDRHVTSPKDAICQGIHLVPSDREKDGLVSGMGAVDSVLQPWFKKLPGKGYWITAGTGRDSYIEARNKLQIIGPEGTAPIDEFSGGNRQKHLIARWAFTVMPKVLLLAQPTQGVDVGAKADIARAIRGLAEEGVTVLISSSESDEIELLCDRAYIVMDDYFQEVARNEKFSETLLHELLMIAEARRKAFSA